MDQASLDAGMRVVRGPPQASLNPCLGHEAKTPRMSSRCGAIWRDEVPGQAGRVAVRHVGTTGRSRLQPISSSRCRACPSATARCRSTYVRRGGRDQRRCAAGHGSGSASEAGPRRRAPVALPATLLSSRRAARLKLLGLKVYERGPERRARLSSVRSGSRRGRGMRPWRPVSIEFSTGHAAGSVCWIT